MGIATDLIIVVIAGLLGGLVARKFNQPLILGYILAGIAVGPFTGGITVSDIDDIEQLAEIGVALLLFSLGLEFSLKSLRPIKAIALGGATLQVSLTLVAGFAIGHLFGWTTMPSLWLAVAVVSSSTAVIAKTLASRGQMGTLSSRVMLGMSIVQDILVIPLMVIMLSLSSSGFSLMAILQPLIKVSLFVAAMLYAGARIIPRIMEGVARWESRELFVLAVTAIGLGVGYLTYALDLSFAFGAFIAGLVLSESDYGRAALNDLIPVRDLFGLLFFVTIGMLFDPAYLLGHWMTIAILLIAISLSRGTILAGTGRLFGYRNVIPLAMFLGMIPISEIAFIVLRQGLESKAIPYDIYSLILNVVILSMLLGPLATGLTGPIYDLVKRMGKPGEIRTVNLPSTGLTDHVIIAGGGVFGRHIGFVLRSLGHPYVIIEPHHATFLKGQEEKLSLLYGDPGQDVILEAAEIEKARLLIITLKGRLATLDVVGPARKRNKTVPIMSRGEGSESRRILAERGVTRVIDPEMEAGLEMARQALIQLDMPATAVQREIEALRRATHNSLFDGSEYEALSHLRQATGLIHLEWVYLHEDNPLVGKKLSETPIRPQFGLSVVAVGRGETVLSDVDSSFTLLAGDYVAVVGTQEQNRRFVEAFAGRKGPAKG